MEWLFWAVPLSAVSYVISSLIGISDDEESGKIARFIAVKLRGNKTAFLNTQIRAAVESVKNGSISYEKIDYDSLKSLIEATRHQKILDESKTKLFRAIESERNIFATPRTQFVKSIVDWVDNYNLLVISTPSNSEYVDRTAVYKEWKNGKRRVKIEAGAILTSSNRHVKQGMRAVLNANTANQKAVYGEISSTGTDPEKDYLPDPSRRTKRA